MNNSHSSAHHVEHGTTPTAQPPPQARRDLFPAPPAHDVVKNKLQVLAMPFLATAKITPLWLELGQKLSLC